MIRKPICQVSAQARENGAEEGENRLTKDCRISPGIENSEITSSLHKLAEDSIQEELRAHSHDLDHVSAVSPRTELF